MSEVTEAAIRHLLIEPTELADLLEAQQHAAPGAPRTHVLDVRWTLARPNGHVSYLGGHIPGAVYVDLESELSAHGAPEQGRHPLPGTAALTASARHWGISEGDTVVAYDDGGNLAAARAWWLLRDAGFADVRLLNGALPAWREAGLPLDTANVTPAPSTITLSSGHMPVLEFEDVADFASEHTLIDARATERFTGNTEPIDPRAGHIPGARSIPTSEHLDPAGRFLTADELRARFAGASADPLEPAGTPQVAFYCGSGITASHAVFAYALAGGTGALYPGSWSQWSNHPELEAAMGPDAG